MSDLKDSLYDTDDAIALSLQLTGKQTAGETEHTPYIRFSAGPRVMTPAQKSAPVAVEQKPPEPEVTLPDTPFETGEELLKWCIETAEATAGFITDGQGFVIMKEGSVMPDDGYDGAGANMGMVVDQLNRMELDKGDIQLADLIYQDGFMLIISAKDKESDIYNIGIVGATPMKMRKKKAIYQQVRKNLMQLAL